MKNYFKLAALVLFLTATSSPVYALTSARLIKDNLLVCTSSSCATIPNSYGGIVMVENKIGVNIANPTSPLQVFGSDGVTLAQFGNGTAFTKLTPNELYATGDNLYLNFSTAYNTVLATGGGNVGIGTTNPRVKLEIAGSLASKAAIDSGNDYTYYDVNAVNPMVNTNIYSYGSICSQNYNGDCTGGGGTVISGANTTIDSGFFSIRHGSALGNFSGNTSYAGIYPNYPSVTSAPGGLKLNAGNGSNGWVNGGFYYADSSSGGLLSNLGNWALRIPYNSQDIINDYGNVGFNAYPNSTYKLTVGGTVPNYNTLFRTQLYVASNTDGYVSMTGTTGSAYNVKYRLLNAGSAKWDIGLSTTGGDSSGNNFEIYAYGGQNSHELFCFFNSTKSCYTYGPWRIPGASTRVVRFKNASTTDSWLRLVGDNDNGVHNLAVGSIYYNGAVKFDLAEMSPVNPADQMRLGQLVSVDNSHDFRLTLANKNNINSLSGIVSHVNTASLVIGGEVDAAQADQVDDMKPIALAGRVVTLVNIENGEISQGDGITVSSISGVGAKATNTTRIVSKAMEKFDGTTVNSLGVNEIISKIKAEISTTHDENRINQLKGAIAQLTADLPDGTGRIISYISKQQSLSEVDQETLNNLYQNEQTINKLKEKIAQLKNSK